MEKKKEFTVCPQCGSTNMKWLLGGKLGDQYKCSDCSYQGIAFKGDKYFIKDLKEKKGEQND